MPVWRPIRNQYGPRTKFSECYISTNICNLFGAKTTRSTPYHPSSNGLIERFNGTLAKMLRCFTADNPTQWDLYLPALTAAYRSTVHPATGFTPNQLMFGREVNTPLEMLFPEPRKEGMDIPEYVTNLKDEIENCYQLAREHLKSNSERQKRDHDTRLSQQEYKPGDLVYRLNPIQKKLEA